MNTIKIYLAESGATANLIKDFPLYQGSFQNKLLNIFVPTSIIAPYFMEYTDGKITTQDLTSTAVKIGCISVTRSGKQAKSDTYYVRYLKTIMYQNVEYALYERILPQAFTFYAGQGENAPKLVANVVVMQKDTETQTTSVLSITTSQTCTLDVMQSTNLDSETPLQPSELDEINGDINNIQADLLKKQESIDSLDERVTANETAIADDNAQTDSNTERIIVLENKVGAGLNFIGDYPTTSVFPTKQQLTQFVVDTINRQPQAGDFINVHISMVSDFAETYAVYYGVNGWGEFIKQPNVYNEANNNAFGWIKGTANEDVDLKADIQSGVIKDILIKDNKGLSSSIRTLINSNAETITKNTNDIETIQQEVEEIKENGLSIADEAITTPKIAPNAVTYDKLATAVQQNFFRPNILINGGFKINQRGQSSYSVPSGLGYTVDRWNASMCDVIVNDGSITMTPTTVGCSAQQFLESGAIIVGNTYTLSATVDGVRKSITFVASEDVQSEVIYFDNNVEVSFDGVSGQFAVSLLIPTSASSTFSKIKLEQGSYATPYIEPDYTLELLRCQRTEIKYTTKGTILGNGFVLSNGTTVRIVVSTPVTMRTTPTINFSGLYISAPATYASGAKLLTGQANLISVTGNQVAFEVTADGLTANQPCVLQIRETDGYLEFDAEL